jgi:hypothetical protein
MCLTNVSIIVRFTVGYLLRELYTTQTYFVTLCSARICVIVVGYSSLGNPLCELVR